MSLFNRIRCLANGHQFSPPRSQECWWVIECQCCGASRTADSVLELLLSPVEFRDAPGVTCESPERLQRTLSGTPLNSSTPVFAGRPFQANPQ